MRSFSIQKANVSDCSECTELLLEQLAEHGVDSSATQLTELLEQVVKNELRGLILLARDDARVIGVAYCPTILSLEHCGHVAWLEELFVSPSHRNLRVGTALVGAVLAYAKEFGVVAVDLEIDESHNRVESLYRRFDFQLLNRSRWVRKLRI
jgi:GNAT superfamily N-acetyltransferase